MEHASVQQVAPAQTELRVVDPINDPQWDVAISRFPEASPFHTSGWARVLHESYGFRPVYLATGPLPDATAVLPLMEVDSWLTGRRGVCLPFTDGCGPLGPSTETVALLAAARVQARQRNWRFLEIRSASPEPDALPSTRYFGHTLDLTVPESDLLEGTEPAVRRALRKAQKSDLTVASETSISAFREFLRLLALTRRRHGAPPQPTLFLSNLYRLLLMPAKASLFLARRGGTAVAGALFLHHGQRVLYKFGGSDLRFQHLRPNNLVMWKAICHFARQGFGQLDFGRTSLRNEGLRRFKLGWGCREQDVSYTRYDCHSGQYIRVPDRADGWQASLLRRLPLPLGQMTGALLYRHVA